MREIIIIRRYCVCSNGNAELVHCLLLNEKVDPTTLKGEAMAKACEGGYNDILKDGPHILTTDIRT